MRANVEDLHRQASGHYLKGDFVAATATWRQVLEHVPEDERAREGIRLCEQLIGGVDAEGDDQDARASLGLGDETLPAGREAHAPDGTTAGSMTSPYGEEIDGEALDCDDELDSAGDLSAANELIRRTETLLAEAREQADAGQVEDALRTLDRVLILDEENATALALQSELRGDDADDDEEADEAPAAVAAPLIEPIDFPPPPVVSVAVGLPQVAPATTPKPSPAPAASRPSARLRGLDRRLLLGGAGAALILTGWVTVRILAGGDVAPVEPAVEVARGPRPAAPAPAPEPPPAPAQPLEADALLREAEAAFQAEDYAAAVIAYDRVLDLEPDRAEVRARLAVAAERYREHQAHEAQWTKAREAFEQENYTESLQLLYRMSKERQGVDLERCKVNGWYNLGLNALLASDCPRATEQFEEAQALDPHDEGVLAGLEMAERCREPEVQDEIRRLAFRRFID